MLFIRWISRWWALAALTVVLPASRGTIIPIVGNVLDNVLDTLDKAVTGLLELPLGYNVQDSEEFEYIVVGAGAGGSAVAARLVQAGKSVLLLEAGKDAPPHAYVPGVHSLLMGSSIDWQYKTRSNNVSCLGSEGQQCRWSRGKAPGGSTTINFMMYVRGNPQDYELGLPGWTWSEFKPYFLRAEGLRSSLPPSSSSYHNTSGPVGVGFCPDPGNNWQENLYNGFKEIGFPENPDVNADTQIGVSKIITYTSDSLRESTARAYLTLPDVKNKIKLSTGTQVTKVTFDENNNANGIEAVRDITNRKITVRASKGVILSAGTIGTPQILMQSGIGPKAHLQDFGIPVLSDLPVGEDVTDHVLPLMFIRVDASLLEIIKYSDQAIQYALNRSGFFASIGVTDITVFLNTTCYDLEAGKLSDGPGCEVPNVQYYNIYIDRGLININIGSSIFKNVLNLNDDMVAQIVKENARGALIVSVPVLLSPYSRGWVRLNSSDPLQQPDIFPNYLGNDRDVDILVDSINILENLVESKPFRNANAELVHLELDNCPDYGVDREGYWRCYVRHLTFSVFHAAGSCALGRVLDERLRVRGVRGLGVADLSAMPRVPLGNTAAVSIAMGERMADFLLNN